MTKIEELKAAFEAANKNYFDSSDEEEAIAKANFIALAHNLMPQLLEAVELLKAVHYEFNEYDEEYWATDLCKKVEALKEELSK